WAGRLRSLLPRSFGACLGCSSIRLGCRCPPFVVGSGFQNTVCGGWPVSRSGWRVWSSFSGVPLPAVRDRVPCAEHKRGFGCAVAGLCFSDGVGVPLPRRCSGGVPCLVLASVVQLGAARRRPENTRWGVRVASFLCRLF